MHAAFDVATALCREGDSLTAVHVESEDVARTKAAEAKYSAECAKVGATRKLAACAFRVTKKVNGSISGAIIEVGREADVLVMGSVELVNVKKRHMLGSVALALAKHGERGAPHLTVVKNFPH